MNAFTTKSYTEKANTVTFQKFIIVLLLWSCKVYPYPHLDRWPWGQIIWFSAPCFHLIENRMQYCRLLFKCCWNPLPKSPCKRQCSLAFVTEMGQAQGKNSSEDQNWRAWVNFQNLILVFGSEIILAWYNNCNCLLKPNHTKIKIYAAHLAYIFQ